MPEILSNNLQIIHDRIRLACERANRDPQEVRLLLATKTVEAQRILLALQQGEHLIGENKVQELGRKYDALREAAPEIHFIGHLQTNKVKEVIQWASCIESVDRLDLAQKLHRRLLLENRTMDVYIQVNTSYEDSKFGVPPENALELIQEVSALTTLKIKGLMTIGLFDTEPEKVRKCFRLLRQIQEQAKALHLDGVELNELSMGMSGDLEIAIAEGATIVRVGTAVFGKRIYPDSYYWNEGNTPS